MWLSRIAGSLVFGAILGGTAAYYALPRFVMAKVSTCAGTDATSPWWNTPAGGYSETASGGAEQSFGERLNKALFAARAGESAAQQSLLVRQGEFMRGRGEAGAGRGRGGILVNFYGCKSLDHRPLFAGAWP